MNRRPEKKRLLADVLADESETVFREALLGETLRQVKRRRRVRQARRATGIFLAALGIALVGWKYVPRLPSPDSSELPTRSYTLVRTHTFLGIVSSQPLSSTAIVSSLPTTSVVSTSDAHQQVPEISDSQLLDLVRPSVAVLVRYSPTDVELVFAHPEERENFLRN